MQRMRALALAGLAAAVGMATVTVPAGAAGAAAAAGPGTRGITVTELPGLGGATSKVRDVNERGQAVGESLTAESFLHAVRWDAGRPVDLTPELTSRPGTGPTGQAMFVTRDGLVAGAILGGFLSIKSDALVWRGAERITLPPAGGLTGPIDLNERGEVLYISTHADNTPPGTLTKVWHDGRATDAPLVGGTPFFGADINNGGLVVGSDRVAGTGAYTWRPGRAPVALPSPAGTQATQAVAVNDRNDVVGVAVLDDQGLQQAYRWRDGRPTALGTLGGASSLVPNSPSNGATPINSWGDIVGFSQTGTGQTHGFFWRNGRMTDIGTLGGPNSFALGVNDAGQVIGISDTGTGGQHPFLWQNGRMLDLTTVPGLEHLVEVQDITNRGQVAGNLRDPAAGTGTAVVIDVPLLWGYQRQ